MRKTQIKAPQKKVGGTKMKTGWGKKENRLRKQAYLMEKTIQLIRQYAQINGTRNLDSLTTASNRAMDQIYQSLWEVA